MHVWLVSLTTPASVGAKIICFWSKPKANEADKQRRLATPTGHPYTQWSREKNKTQASMACIALSGFILFIYVFLGWVISRMNTSSIFDCKVQSRPRPTARNWLPTCHMQILLHAHVVDWRGLACLAFLRNTVYTLSVYLPAFFLIVSVLFNLFFCFF
jgi:hypothetical protein